MNRLQSLPPFGFQHDALHQVRKQGCPSCPALSSPKGGSRQEIADIPRFAAPPGDAHRARGSLIFAPPQHAGCNTSANSFVLLQQLLCRLQSQSLRDLGAEADVEVGFADPHPVQDTGKLARDRDDRAQHARSSWRSAGPRPAMPTISGPVATGLRPPRIAPPEPQRRPAADAALIVDRRSRLVSPRRQAKMRSDRSRSRKASGIIYRHFERKGGNGTITVAPRARGRRPKTFTTAELASRYSHALHKTALAASSFIPLPLPSS